MERKNVYNLTVEIMIQVMQTHKKTGHLQTDLSSGVSGFREPCHVEIALQAGNVISCSITGSQGLLLTGAKAYQELTRQGRLDWTFVPQTQPLTAPAPITDPLTRNTISRPRRTTALTQWQMRPWHDMYKHVYSLADGKRSVTEIAVLLSTTPEAIQEVLHDLQSIGVVAIE
jgi:hypothetical protein